MKAKLGSPIQAAAVFLSGRDRGEWGGVSLSEGWGAAACTGPGLICCSCLEGPTEIEPPAAHGDLVCLPTPFPGGLRDDEAEAARGPRVSGWGCGCHLDGTVPLPPVSLDGRVSQHGRLGHFSLPT